MVLSCRGPVQAGRRIVAILICLLVTEIHCNSTLSLAPLKTCSYTKVQPGDGCWVLSSRCRISQSDLEKYNPTDNPLGFCNSLQVGQYVCCSQGSLPDFSPQPNADGSCSTYTVQKGDLCYSIASAHKMDASQIEERNKKTWGWSGCDYLMVGQNICLSSGDPPMPASIPNAVCGPQVPNTPKPEKGKELSDLNPCPLNACCDIWAQCGTTPLFCTPSSGKTGAPGTAKPGTNGCISNCGTDLVNNGQGPSAFMHVGYFEGWNFDRPCLHMMPSDIDTGLYTHVHFGFGNITRDYEVDLGGYPDVFDSFLRLKTKKVLSFGGWAFSTSPDTYSIFRTGVTSANRDTFASNVAKFAIDNDLDGLDFDWEYPGAPDIEGVPPGAREEGENYLAFLKTVRAALPGEKSLSIAAPASYWYLRGFPIREIAEVVDYVIYMTYDLHGQWDFDNKFVNEGCPNGNCLRSHVNLTETGYALAMITKAGIPAKKVVVGMAKYGRGFKMSDPSCHGPECTFTGPGSGAKEGRCTKTAGYISNFEIKEIIDHQEHSTWHDEGDILIYDHDQWVSYMSAETYDSRLNWIKAHNLGGVSDWAVDLDKDFLEESPTDEGDDEGGDTESCDLKVNFHTLEDLQAAAGNYSQYCVDIYATKTLFIELQTTLDNYTDVNKGYDARYDDYARYMQGMIIPAIDKFMDGKGYTYFECVLYEDGLKRTIKCPRGGGGSKGVYKIEWVLKDSDGFYEKLANDYGVEKGWVKFDNFSFSDAPCATGCASGDRWNLNYPTKADNVVIPNPKDIITKVPEAMSNLQILVEATYLDILLGQWDGANADVARTIGMPIAFVEQAVESMAQVKKTAKKIKDAQRKNLILTILSAVLFLVPFVGEFAAASAGLAGIARAIALAGEASNAALSIYEIVQDPKSAPMAVMGMLLGAASLPRNGGSFSTMSTAVRSMKAEDMGKMGSIFTRKADLVKTILRECS